MNSIIPRIAINPNRTQFAGAVSRGQLCAFDESLRAVREPPLRGKDGKALLDRHRIVPRLSD
jgi:hypothetical protein